MVAAGCAPAATSASSSVVAVGEGLNGPPGIRATVYARGLPNVSAFAVDTRGRLFAAVAGYSAGGQDGVYLVSEAGAAPVKVVSVSTPLGLALTGETLYVSSSSGVDAYSRLVGTVFAQRTRLITFPAGTGELNNIALAPDGRIVLGISAPCDHCTPASPLSGSIVSFKRDGSDLRIVASGIRAPFGLAYDAQGRLLASINQRDDLGKRTPGDWLAAIQTGQYWGFPACYGQGGSGCASMPKPIAVLDRHGAAGGVTIAGNDALVAEWAKGRVLRVSLATNTVTTWLAGLSNPLPLLTVPGGSVLVGDWKTGVVYRIASQ